MAVHIGKAVRSEHVSSLHVLRVSRSGFPEPKLRHADMRTAMYCHGRLESTYITKAHPAPSETQLRVCVCSFQLQGPSCASFQLSLLDHGVSMFEGLLNF